MIETSDRPVAIISGSARGIGAECARALAARDLNVVINFTRSEQDAERVAAQCRARGAETCLVRADISDDDACRALVSAALAQWGRLDVLINNAGITRFSDAAGFDAQSAQDFVDIFAVNVIGTYQLTRAAAPYLKKSPIASVVNVSSDSAFSGMGSSIAYCASKGALNTLTVSLARALAPEVRVNAVCPSLVDTDWLSGKYGSEDMRSVKQREAELSALKHLVTPHDVAETVLLFALGASATTGQCLLMDSGLALNAGAEF